MSIILLTLYRCFYSGFGYGPSKTLTKKRCHLNKKITVKVCTFIIKAVFTLLSNQIFPASVCLSYNQTTFLTNSNFNIIGMKNKSLDILFKFRDHFIKSESNIIYCLLFPESILQYQLGVLQVPLLYYTSTSVCLRNTRKLSI